MFPRNCKDRIEIRRLAIEMHWQDHLRAGRDRPLDQSGIDVVGALVWLDWDRRRAALADREPGGDISVGGHNDFIARSDAERAQGEMQGVETIGDADGVSRFAKVREFRLESLHLRPENIPAAVEHTRDSAINLGLQFEIGCAKIEERDLRHLRPCAARYAVVIAKIIGFVVTVGGQHEAHGARGEIIEFAPNHRTDIEPVIGAGEMKALLLPSVIQNDVETARHGDDELMHSLCAWPPRSAPPGTS